VCESDSATEEFGNADPHGMFTPLTTCVE